jgi:hypothetical protein
VDLRISDQEVLIRDLEAPQLRLAPSRIVWLGTRYTILFSQLFQALFVVSLEEMLNWEGVINYRGRQYRID